MDVLVQKQATESCFLQLTVFMLLEKWSKRPGTSRNAGAFGKKSYMNYIAKDQLQGPW